VEVLPLLSFPPHNISNNLPPFHGVFIPTQLNVPSDISSYAATITQLEEQTVSIMDPLLFNISSPAAQDIPSNEQTDPFLIPLLIKACLLANSTFLTLSIITDQARDTSLFLYHTFQPLVKGLQRGKHCFPSCSPDRAKRQSCSSNGRNQGIGISICTLSYMGLCIQIGKQGGAKWPLEFSFKSLNRKLIHS